MLKNLTKFISGQHKLFLLAISESKLFWNSNTKIYYQQPVIQHQIIRCYTEKNNSKFNAKIPKLIYFHNPWKYLRTRWKMLKLKLLWDGKFSRGDFIRGSKQAAIVITDHVRKQETKNLMHFTTPMGFHQISRDMQLSKGDPRLKMIHFRSADIKRAIPVKVMLFQHRGFRHCIIDMFFVGMRNVNDYQFESENRQVENFLKQYDELNKKVNNKENSGSKSNDFIRIIFAEIFIRFYRDYTNRKFLDDWNVSFYKVINFDVLKIKN